MELLKTSTDWAKAEAVSSAFFILFGIIFILASIGFSQFGKTDVARAYVIPTCLAGILILAIGLGLTYTNTLRVTEFASTYNKDASAFIESEITRVESTLKEYRRVVFTIIPTIIAICALIIPFINTPIFRASMTTTITMMAIVLLIDGMAHARIDAYYEILRSEISLE